MHHALPPYHPTTTLLFSPDHSTPLPVPRPASSTCIRPFHHHFSTRPSELHHHRDPHHRPHHAHHPHCDLVFALPLLNRLTLVFSISPPLPPSLAFRRPSTFDTHTPPRRPHFAFASPTSRYFDSELASITWSQRRPHLASSLSFSFNQHRIVTLTVTEVNLVGIISARHDGRVAQTVVTWLAHS